MAGKRIFATGNMTFTPTASGSQATTLCYMSMVGGAAAQVTDILQVMISGKAAATAIGAMYLNRQSTLGTGAASALTGQNSDGPMHPATAALAAPVVCAVDYATNEAIPSSAITDARLQLGLNLFGGIVRWDAGLGQQYTMSTNAAPAGGAILWNNSSAGGASGIGDAHIMYETY